jgi:flagellar hook-associated protein 3 FlgL
LEGYKDNDGDPATTDYVEISDDDVNDILRNSLDKVGSAYDAINIAHSKLGARNKIFENANEGVVSKITHYTILLQEVGGADLSKVAMEAQALEMTYNALYSTISKLNGLSLLNYLK